MSSPWSTFLAGIVFASCLGTIGAQTSDPAPTEADASALNHTDCPYFGPQRERYITDALRRKGVAPDTRGLSRLTQGVTAMLPHVPGRSRTTSFDQKHAAGSIDSYIFADLQKNGITPAPQDHRLGVHPPRHARPDRPHSHARTACSPSSPTPPPTSAPN